MSTLMFILLTVVSFAGGVANAVAGGGSLLLYPVLIAMGIPPINANATFTVVVLPGQVSSAFGYRKFITKIPRRYYLLIIPALIGCLVGAVMLGRTTNRAFEHIVPWFMIFATVLITAQPKIHKWLYTRQGKKLGKQYHTLLNTIIFLFMFVISIYGGYFGAGFGIVLLAFLGLSELTNVNQLNGLKNLIGIAINLVVVAYFAHIGLIDWSILPALVIGSTVGGWFGATFSSKLPTKVIRRIIIAIGVLVSIALFAHQYIL